MSQKTMCSLDTSAVTENGENDLLFIEAIDLGIAIKQNVERRKTTPHTDIACAQKEPRKSLADSLSELRREMVTNSRKSIRSMLAGMGQA